MYRYKYFISAFIFTLLLGGVAPYTLAQTPTPNKKDVLETDSIPEIDLDTEEDELLGIKKKRKKKKRKKKKRDKKRWFGYSTKKTYVRNRSRRYELEIVRYLDEWPDLEQDRDKYVQEIYYYDAKRRRVRSAKWAKIRARLKKGDKLYLLHGLYRKQINKKLREKGYFFMGMKHSTWEKFDRKYILLTKEKYNRGWRKNSKISYYDGSNGQKIKEVIPMYHKTKHGMYYFFYDNGRIAIKGKYQYNQKIKRWTYYYKGGNRKKMEQYPNRFYQTLYNKKETPFDLYRWNARGQQTYDYTRDYKKGRK
ncbi:toxin-antitoxin system YwqK family antitoxin [Microscilla marina]|uniref:Uncharacterized protein n=1 Tax=Microscilla marina ATCC 23134 TaxID=313606 RepID=A1ZH36_MICM2|nr:hypothetical protein [Microscilla marina]EAY30305.1 hypothetical protein M23134_08129 [Microscilla marina ATCC 23134]